MHVLQVLISYPFPEKMEFLTTWKNIPAQNEYQSTLNVSASPDEVERKLEANNIFKIANRAVGDQQLLYMSAIFVNNIKVLAELKISPENNIQVRVDD